MSDFGHFKTVAARKAHQCNHCLSPISVGEKHLSVAGRFDGDFYTYRIHLECQQASRDFDKVAGFEFDDEHPWLHDLAEHEGVEWLADAYPQIHARIFGKSSPKVGEAA